ncbi:hypothetical protein RJ639_045941 [Escallonia herrerae]|uniref:Tubby-like F-box protein n=1 Tax=Escallonia herrerae TaxID=1293975 RepID=A0AA89B222_9ASTE|nr:hypothetical protein RJ639_045941 [Escallonia herrerae]
MPFKCLGCELMGIRDGTESKSRRRAERKCGLGRGSSYIAPETERSPPPSASIEQSRWANMPPELLLDIIRRLEASETSWPARRDMVSCAAVCRTWRETTKEVVRTPEQCGLLTFPVSLKQPGPREAPIQCYIKRERATSTYRLYLGLSPEARTYYASLAVIYRSDGFGSITALTGDASKLLLIAKKFRRATHTEFIISLVADDFSRDSDTYVGKLRSNFLGTKFVVQDSQAPCDPTIQFTGRSHQKVNLKGSPRLPVANRTVATISYELNILRTRGPRRMQCTMHLIPLSAIEEGGSAPTPETFGSFLNKKLSPLSVSKAKNQGSSSTSPTEPLESICNRGDPLILKNKAPRWHEQLQCWCLNFKGRITVASVKNFQLVASVGPSQNVPAAEQEKVILQFGKIGKDIFTMDFRYPLSAFHAFATCLSSFDTKPACE